PDPLGRHRTGRVICPERAGADTTGNASHVPRHPFLRFPRFLPGPSPPRSAHCGACTGSRLPGGAARGCSPVEQPAAPGLRQRAGTATSRKANRTRLAVGIPFFPGLFIPPGYNADTLSFGDHCHAGNAMDSLTKIVTGNETPLLAERARWRAEGRVVVWT